MRKDQKGFTLVELLIAIAIFAIVTAAVCSFIIVGSRSYTDGNSDITLQQEAQLALNQMSDVLIDTTRSVNYAGYDDSGAPTLVLKDSELTFEPSGKSLTMYNGTSVIVTDGDGNEFEAVEEGNGNKNYQFYWDKADENLYYMEVDVTDDFPKFPDSADDGTQWVVLAEHVTDFSIDLTQVEEKRAVQIAMVFEYGNRVYNTSNNVTIRNKVAVNDAEIKALDRSRKVGISLKETAIVLEPGETYHFSVPIVTGTNVMDKSVTWSMASSYADCGFIDSVNGILQIGNDALAGSFEVMATTNAVDSKGESRSASVTVHVKRVESVDLYKASDEDPENAANQVSAGKQFVVGSNVRGWQLGVACHGCTDDYSTDKDVINWEVVGPAVMEGSDVKQATFRVDSGAKAGDTIIIRATSYLSTRRVYPDVIGELVLTVAQAQESEMFLDGDLRYGRATKIGEVYPGFNLGGQGYYIVCARLKESLDAPASQDKIMLYGTNGNDAWITPDLFGLDVSKPWYLSIQIIDPGVHFNVGDAVVSAVVADYQANCDGSGTYNGQYPHTSKQTWVIYPPAITYSYNGENGIQGELTMDPLYAAKGGGSNVFSVYQVANTIGDPNAGEIGQLVKFKAYREDANGNWGNPIYYYDENSGGYQGNSRVGALQLNISNALNPNITLEQNNPMEAVGKYHIMPLIRYVNSPSADHSYNVYWQNYETNYWQVQLYEVPYNAIHFEVKAGNITIKMNDGTEWEGYFTIPSDYSEWDSTSFNAMFELKKTDLQHANLPSWGYWATFYNKKNPSEQKSMQITDITCRYIAANDEYEIEIFYAGDYVWDSTTNTGGTSIYSAGVFKCKSNGNTWEQISGGYYKGIQ